jgi:uncharacterized protein (DUF2235 family)
VYILGFSRGAYTARSLVGMIRNCGLIYPKHLALRVAIAYGIYRTRDDKADSTTAKLFRRAFSREIKIKFIGVWDTVGALGIPLDVLADANMKYYEFHDTPIRSHQFRQAVILRLVVAVFLAPARNRVVDGFVAETGGAHRAVVPGIFSGVHPS